MNTTIPNWVRISSIMIFAMSFVIGMALVSWYEIGEVQDDTALATTIAIIVKGQAVSVLSTALGGVIEGSAYIVVIATYIVQKNREEGHAEGLAEGLKQGRSEGLEQGLSEGLELGRTEGRTEGIERGRSEGITEGIERGRSEGISTGLEQGIEHGLKQGRTQGIAEAYADANAKNAAYFRRMKEALERGEDFDEPPPTFGAKQD